MQRIAFFCFNNQINFYHVGGLDSLARRLAIYLAQEGDKIYFVHYGSTKNKRETIKKNIEQIHFTSLQDAFEFLSLNCDDVVSVYLYPRDRLAYAKFRRKYQDNVRFHHIYSVWNESKLKRELLFSEAKMFPYNGCLFCLSPRFHKTVTKWAPRSKLLLPPVPDDFFCDFSEKPDNDLLRVTYAGRVDPGKGTQEAIEVFERLQKEENINARVCGYAWSHREATMRLHEKLLANPGIRYEPVEHKSWSPKVDEDISEVLRETDILLLPYQKLSSTIDTPLLLLEGMASLCAIITPQLGDLHKLYGKSSFLLQGRWNTLKVTDLIRRNRSQLLDEKKRILSQNSQLKFDIKNVVKLFKQSMLEIQ